MRALRFALACVPVALYVGCSGPRNAPIPDLATPPDLPRAPQFDWAWRPPAPPHAGACAPEEVDWFPSACGAGGSPSTCAVFAAAHARCFACVDTDARASAWGPRVHDDTVSLLNAVGCVAAVEGDPGPGGCGARIYAREVCLSRCAAASDEEACRAAASRSECRARLDAAAACYAKLGLDRSGTPFDVCAVDQPDDAALRSLVGFFCGAP